VTSTLETIRGGSVVGPAPAHACRAKGKTIIRYAAARPHDRECRRSLIPIRRRRGARVPSSLARKPIEAGTSSAEAARIVGAGGATLLVA
jgi:hypothetical protein